MCGHYILKEERNDLKAKLSMQLQTCVSFWSLSVQVIVKMENKNKTNGCLQQVPTTIFFLFTSSLLTAIKQISNSITMVTSEEI